VLWRPLSILQSGLWIASLIEAQMELDWDVIGAPSSAGAHTPGVERAPGALREAGLMDLMKRGSDVADLGDVPGFR
jgi:arginase family enzyme